jgi:transposase
MTGLCVELFARKSAWFRVLAIRDVVGAGDSLTPLESLLNRSPPGRARRLLYWRGEMGHKRKRLDGFPEINANAAGIDVGNAQHYVAVPPGRDTEPVRSFGCFTADLHALADWLHRCRVKTVAMESTGVYWVALYEVLELRGFEVCLVNARQAKNLPGRKTDVKDCQWLQQLHSYGLLTRSFRPQREIVVLRRYLRHRETLVQEAGTCIQRMQKALTEMNVQLANVISDISGVRGMRILRAIVEGERDPRRLAKLRDRRIKASEEEVSNGLYGTWGEELVFVLEENLALYDMYRQKIGTCDERIEQHLKTMSAKTDVPTVPIPAPRKGKRSYRNAPTFDLRSELYRITGTDLTQIDGIDVSTAQVVLAETGPDMSAWRTEKHFVSWLGLCPDHRISGGKVLKRGTRNVVCRAATAFRMAASTLRRSQSALGAKYRRLQSRLGPAKAITAMAHQLARLFYRMVKFGAQYIDHGMAAYEQRFREQQLKWLAKKAAELHLSLTPMQPA